MSTGFCSTAHTPDCSIRRRSSSAVMPVSAITGKPSGPFFRASLTHSAPSPSGSVMSTMAMSRLAVAQHLVGLRERGRLDDLVSLRLEKALQTVARGARRPRRRGPAAVDPTNRCPPARPRRPSRAREGRRGRPAPRGSGSVKDTLRAFPLAAVEEEVAPHDLDELLGDREPEPGAAPRVVRTGADLAERLERRRDEMSRDAAAGVLDLERDRLLPRRGAQDDAALPACS